MRTDTDTGAEPAIADARPGVAAGLPPWADRLATAAVVLCLVVPLVFHHSTVFPYVVPRAALFRVALGMALVALLILLFTRRYRLVDPSDPVFTAMLAFVLVSALTGLLGVAPSRSTFGEIERMWGVVTWFYLLVLYATLRLFGERRLRRLLATSVAVSSIVALYAAVQHYHHVLLIPVHGAGREAVHATLGNPSYLSIYLAIHVGIAILLAIRARAPVGRGLSAAAALANAAAFTFGGGRAPLLGLFAGGLAGGAMLFACSGRESRSRLVRATLLTGVGLLAVASVLFLSPVRMANPLVRRVMALHLESTTVTSRLAAWGAGWKSAVDRPLLGIGMENFQIAYFRHYPARMDALGSSGVWDRAHNNYLEVLVGSGVAGLAAYLAIWASFFWTVAAARRRRALSCAESAVATAVGVAYLVYLLAWFEDLSSTIPMVLLLAFVSTARSGGPLMRFEARTSVRWRRYAGAGAAAVVVALFTYQHAVRVLGATRMAQSAHEERDPRLRFALLEGALEIGATEALPIIGMYVDDLRGFAVGAPEIAAHPHRAEALWPLIVRGALEVERAIELDPENPRWWVDRSRLLALAAEVGSEPRYHQASLASLHHAISLSPTQPRLYHILADLQVMGGNADSARVALDQAEELSSATGETDRVRARVYLAAGEADSSRVALMRALRKGAVDRLGLVEWHLEQLRAANRAGAALDLLDAYAAGLELEGMRRSTPLTSGDFELLSRRPLLALRLGREQEAAALARELAVRYPAAAEILACFITDVSRGHGSVWVSQQDFARAAGSFGGLGGGDRLRR